MFKISAFSFEARCELFAKAQNRFADCFIGQIIPDSLHGRFLRFWFQLTKAY